MIELGISTFGETTPLEETNTPIPHDVRIRELIEEIELADRVGLDVYGIGEHHRADFAVSAPEIVLAGGAINTKHIKLTSAVTVLSSSDPVRVYQQYATIDALSNGRAEVMVGRGSFTESFPLFGYSLNDYESLFDEKLEMLLQINNQATINWTGTLTQSLSNISVYPKPASGKLPIWVATGGNAESTIKIAQKGLSIAYAIIGGNPLAFGRLINAYRHIFETTHGKNDNMKVAAHSWGYIADTTEEAVKDYYFPMKQTIDAISKDRPFWTPLTKEGYLQMIGPNGATFVGDPDTVADRLIQMIEALKLDRFLLHLPIGSMPHEKIMHAIELFGTKVAPKIREYFANKENAS